MFRRVTERRFTRLTQVTSALCSAPCAASTAINNGKLTLCPMPETRRARGLALAGITMAIIIGGIGKWDCGYGLIPI